MKSRRLLGACHQSIQRDHLSDLARDFDLLPAASPFVLQKLVASQPLHGAILHYPIFSREHVSIVSQCKAHSAWLPFIVLADQFEVEAMRRCSEVGIDAFIACSEKAETKLAMLSSALRTGGFRSLIMETGRPPTTWPFRMKQAFELIMENFPQTPGVDEIAVSVGTHRRTFEKEFQKTFGLSYVPFLRVLFMYEAWHLKHYTNLSNSEIAAFLGYSAETHLARDCQKVFELSPKHLRELPEKNFRTRLKKVFGP